MTTEGTDEMLMIEPNPITPASRDHELLRMLAQGYSNKVIANSRNVSPLAAKKQIQALFLNNSRLRKKGPRFPDERRSNTERKRHSPQHKRLECTSTGCPVRNATPDHLAKHPVGTPNLQVARSRVARCGTAASSSLGDYTCSPPPVAPSLAPASSQRSVRIAGEQPPLTPTSDPVTLLPKPPLRTAASATRAAE